MRVKICGLCRPEDATLAAAAGAEYAGVVLAPGFLRSQSVWAAEAIYDGAAGMRRVGVFVDQGVSAISAAATALALDIIQLHGSQDPAGVRSLRSAGGWRIWKSVRPRDGREFAAALALWANVVDGLLVDGYSAFHGGGTGVSFPWAEVARYRARVPAGLELVVAGGLTPDNVIEAIELLAPDTVDVSSGVEEAPGIKSQARVRAFVAASRSVLTRYGNQG